MYMHYIGIIFPYSVRELGSYDCCSDSFRAAAVAIAAICVKSVAEPLNAGTVKIWTPLYISDVLVHSKAAKMSANQHVL